MMDERDLGTLFEFLKFQSVSTDPERSGDVAACAEWLAETMRESGLQAEVRPTGGHPVVLGWSERVAGRKTVLIYGHYDVQPEDPADAWSTPPFEPVIKEGRIYARGASDNKGQILSHLLGVRHALAAGDLPVNLVFLVEGEEEVGSPHLRGFVERYRDLLACDVVAISDTGMFAPGWGTLTYGLRGILAMELRVRGPRIDLHSGIFGGAVANPATVVARLVAELHDAEWRVRVPGFYGGIVPLSDAEREAWGELPDPEASLLRLTGVPLLAGEAGYGVLERMWARPTAEVNGLGGGFQGEGSKTVIPREAFAKLTFRLVPGQDPERIADLVEEFLRERVPAGVELEIVRGHAGRPYLNDPTTPESMAARRALERVFGRPPALIREGGSIPVVQDFAEVLGVPVLLLGLADPDAQAHGPDESFPVANFEAGMRLNRELLRELA
jgi:acetylornithine deacetylase/succinyl-diaminopimelate desuccinylase-like protein